MGQRLNIEIWNNGEVLANAYYHWSAYTGSAAAITRSILNNIDTSAPVDVMYAVRLLEKTGAGVNHDESERIKAEGKFPISEFKPGVSRDEGLLAVTENGIIEARYWEEHRVSIYLDESRVDFGVFHKLRTYQWEKDYGEDYSGKKACDLRKVNANLSDIKFDKFDEVFNMIPMEEDFVTTTEVGTVYMPIY